MPNLKRYKEDTHYPYIHIPGYEGLISLDKGLISIDKGLYINKFTALQTGRQIDKAICRQIDKPYMLNMPNSTKTMVCQEPLQTTVYKRYTNIPYIRHMLAIYKGLDIKVWIYAQI